MGVTLRAAILIFTFLTTVITHAYAIGTYSVVAPQVLRPNKDYTVVVSTHGTRDIVHLTVEVGGLQDSVGVVILNRQVVKVEPDTSQTIKFEIGELGPGDYNLTVTGQVGLSFTNTTRLQYEPKSYSVFIQTDKGIYKPGDTIKFRAVVVNPYLRPSVTGAIDIFVMDGKGNRVKQWQRVFTTKGVFSGEVELSEEPVLGRWNITVEVLGQSTTAAVLVAEYVLPKFEVEVELPEFATFDEEFIVATVKSRYTHGRPVRGEVTIQVSPTYKYGYLQAPYDEPISVVKMMKGTTHIKFNLRNDLRLKDDYVRELSFTAYVKEDFTKRVQNATSKVTFYKYPYRMQFIRTSDSFKPGLKYTAYLKLSMQDDSPIREGQVKVRHAFSRDPEDFTENIHHIPPSGVVPLEFYPPISNKSLNLALEAQYLDLTQWLADLTRAQSPSNAFIQATMITRDPRVGEEIIVALNATQPLVYFVYKILGRGDVLFAQTLQAHAGTTHSFRFVATAAMAPRARLIVYYVREDGEVVADSLHFAVDGTMQNPVTVSVNPRRSDAGQDIAITVTTKPNAFVGISAIDQSSLLLASANDITEDGIISELETYDAGQIDELSPWHFLANAKRRKRSLLSWHGTTTAADVFKNSGVVILSNGYIHDFNPFNLRAMESRVAPSSPFAVDDGDTLKTSRVRSRFLETWIFAKADSGFNGVVTMREKAPDTITSYIVNAFAIDDFHGLGVAEAPAKLTVFRPFFVSVHVPSSVVREEAVAIEMVVFNYGKREVTARVTLDNPGDFLFPDFANEIDQGSPATERTKVVTVSPEDGTPLSFMINPITLGNIDIKVTATSDNAVDVVSKKLFVKPEGTTLTVNRAFLVDLREQKSFMQIVNITTPRNIVPDSLQIQATAIGDIFGAAITDLESLLEIPTGCGEQNMAKMTPNVVLMEYLKSRGELTETLIGRARRNLELGYQRQLTFRHEDGSFSAFGDKDKMGSTWLTAFVAKSFASASRHIDIDPVIIQEATQWLVTHQAVDGSFKEIGVINNQAIQGGASKGVPLTAYVLTALLQLQKDLKLEGLRNPTNRAIEYLVAELEFMEDPYSLALTTYALQYSNHPFRDTAFYQLEGKANVKDEYKWWQVGDLQSTIETTVTSLPLDIEMTSYALLTYSLRGLARDALPVLRWLTSQRNQHGGFQTTQDTSVGMAALSSVATLMYSPNPRLEVQLITGARGDTISINNKNAMVLQRRELTNDTESVTVKARGSGVAVVQVTYNFNVEVSGPGPAFSLDPQLDQTTTSNKLRLTTCAGYTSGNESNMAVLDVSLPSGYVMDNDLIPTLYNYPRVKRVEKKPDSEGVLIYFDSLSATEVCPTIAAYRVSKVAFQKKTPVKIYDYYDLSRQARQFYTPSPATLCDICDLDECDAQRCEQQIVQLNRQLSDPEDFAYPTSYNEISAASRQSLLLWIMGSILVVVLRL